MTQESNGELFIFISNAEGAGWTARCTRCGALERGNDLPTINQFLSMVDQFRSAHLGCEPGDDTLGPVIQIPEDELADLGEDTPEEEAWLIELAERGLADVAAGRVISGAELEELFAKLESGDDVEVQATDIDPDEIPVEILDEPEPFEIPEQLPPVEVPAAPEPAEVPIAPPLTPFEQKVRTLETSDLIDRMLVTFAVSREVPEEAEQTRIMVAVYRTELMRRICTHSKN